jgi:hypothetical protein
MHEAVFSRAKFNNFPKKKNSAVKISFNGGAGDVVDVV